MVQTTNPIIDDNDLTFDKGNKENPMNAVKSHLATVLALLGAAGAVATMVSVGLPCRR